MFLICVFIWCTTEKGGWSVSNLYSRAFLKDEWWDRIEVVQNESVSEFRLFAFFTQTDATRRPIFFRYDECVLAADSVTLVTVSYLPVGWILSSSVLPSTGCGRMQMLSSISGDVFRCVAFFLSLSRHPILLTSQTRPDNRILRSLGWDAKLYTRYAQTYVDRLKQQKKKRRSEKGLRKSAA